MAGGFLAWGINGLEQRHVDLARKAISVLGKGNKRRDVSLTDEAVALFRDPDHAGGRWIDRDDGAVIGSRCTWPPWVSSSASPPGA